MITASSRPACRGSTKASFRRWLYRLRLGSPVNSSCRPCCRRASSPTLSLVMSINRTASVALLPSPMDSRRVDAASTQPEEPSAWVKGCSPSMTLRCRAARVRSDFVRPPTIPRKGRPTRSTNATPTRSDRATLADRITHARSTRAIATGEFSNIPRNRASDTARRRSTPRCSVRSSICVARCTTAPDASFTAAALIRTQTWAPVGNR